MSHSNSNRKILRGDSSQTGVDEATVQQELFGEINETTVMFRHRNLENPPAAAVVAAIRCGQMGEDV